MKYSQNMPKKHEKPLKGKNTKPEQQKQAATRLSDRSDGAIGAVTFGPRNYLMLAGGLSIIVITFVLMYMEGEVDGFFSLNIAPITLTGSYIWIGFAIMYRQAPPLTDKPGT